MVVSFEVKEEEKEKLAFILDADISEEEKKNKLVEYLHGLIAKQPVPLKAPVAPFVWEEEMNPYIQQHGPILCWLDGKSTDIQAFVEHISNELGYMFDWAYLAGRAHIDFDPDASELLEKYLEEHPEPWVEFNCRRIA